MNTEQIRHMLPVHNVRHLLQMWLDLDDANAADGDVFGRATRETNLRQWTHEWLDRDPLRTALAEAEQEIAILREQLADERHAHGQFGMGA